jgi:NAD(P)H dehydrogenase (quinone)
MILVTGANGKLGYATIEFIQQKNSQAKIAALVREASKGESLQQKGVELRIGDYMDYISLLQAFEGIEVLVFISSGTVVSRVQQHKNVVRAAKEKGIKHIIYTSFLGASDNTPGIFQDHTETEKEILASGIVYTLLRNTYYDDLLPMLVGDALKNGRMYYHASNAKINLASRRDIAEALANVALHAELHKNKIYEITSANAYSFPQIAQMLSEASGKPISYTDISFEQLKEGLKSTGLPEGVVGMIASISKMISNGMIDYTDPALENLLGRKPVDLKDTIGAYVKNNVNN